MGSIAQAALLAPPPAPDEAHEIGVLPQQVTVGAMRIGEVAGELIYQEETPVAVATVWRVLDYGAGKRHRWWRLEVKTATRRGPIEAGHRLVIAEHPYGNGWVQPVPFRRGSKKGALDRPAATHQTLDSPAALIAWLEHLPFDYWEKGNYLTAGVSEPDLAFMPNDQVRNVRRQGLFVFGWCTDFQRCEQALFCTQAVQRLLRQTAAGTIRFWRFGLKFKNEPPRLRDEVKQEATSLVMLAIRQALAGPHEESARWLGQPVTEKVDQLFRGHLNNRNRLLTRNRRSEQLFGDERAFDVGQGDDEEPF
jgi:hypothetical protein